MTFYAPNMNRTTPKECPKCGFRLIVKAKPVGSRQYPQTWYFLACPNYHIGCRHTEPMTEDIQAELDAPVVLPEPEF